MTELNKEDEVIKGISESRMTVQQSLPILMSLGRSPFTLAELKLLDVYLGRIDSHNPYKRKVIFGKKELEKKLGVTEIKVEELDKRLKNLMTSIRIDDEEERNGFTRIGLFEIARVYEDIDDYQIEMECTQSAMKYIFNIEDKRYLKYLLDSISMMKSRYSYLMFRYIEYNRFRGEWDIGIEELKIVLNCEQEETYKIYKHFNNLVLKKIHKEITELTDCKYIYEPIKKGRSVIAIKFKVQHIPNCNIIDTDYKEIDSETATTNENDDNVGVWYGTEEYEKITRMGLWTSILMENGDKYMFSLVQYEELFNILCSVPEWKMPIDVAIGFSGTELEYRRYNYISQKYSLLKVQMKKTDIKNVYSYFREMIKKDLEY